MSAVELLITRGSRCSRSAVRATAGSSAVRSSTLRSRPAYDSRSCAVMRLNCPASASSSSPVRTSIWLSRSPRRCAARLPAACGSGAPCRAPGTARPAPRSPGRRGSAATVRRIGALSARRPPPPAARRTPSSPGRSPARRERLLARRLDRRVGGQHAAPFRSFASIASDRRAGRERRLHLRQLREVRLAQHQADVRVRHQVAVAVDDVRLALLPDRMRVTTSQMNLRFTSATVTGPDSPPERTAIVMYGSVSLRKYTGPNQVLPGLRVLERGLLRAVPLAPATSIARRDTASCSRPSASICAISVTAGTWRSSFRNSMRRCSRPLGTELRQRGDRRAAARSGSRTARCAPPRRPPSRAAGWRALPCSPGTRSRGRRRPRRAARRTPAPG